jgi:transketolase
MKSLNALKALGVAQVQQANSGHPGIVLGAAPLFHTLWLNHLNVYPQEPTWVNRDRFILSAGHGSALLYATLHLAGFQLPLDELKQFRQWGSKTPGHPEYGHTTGVEATTGPLGQGIAMAVGMDIARLHMASRYNKPSFQLFDYYTYVVCGDGDLQEGVAMEAMSLAGHLGLDHLIVLFDSNDIQLDGPVSDANSENIKAKVQAMNWQYLFVEDGTDQDVLHARIDEAKSYNKPVFIEIKTVIGDGSDLAGDSEAHGAPFSHESYQALLESLEITDPFDISKEVYNEFDQIKQRGKKRYEAYVSLFVSYKENYPELYTELTTQLTTPMVAFEALTHEATRVSSGKVITEMSKKIPYFIGGSADLTKSTKAKGTGGDFSIKHPSGRNINFGVREHAMAAIVNGLTLSGVKAFGGGFLIFSDYCKPSMRLAALMRIGSIFVFTHDSIAVGEDGPTHQPIEQLTGLRAIPNMNVIRPANATETAAAWKLALDSDTNPTTIVLTRQNLINHSASNYHHVKKGAYIISPEKVHADVVLLASGSEVNAAIEAQTILSEAGMDTRVVSMPSMFYFNAQSQDYKESILPANVPVVAIEMATAVEYYQYTPHVIGINTFGASAPGNTNIQNYGFDGASIASRVKEMLDLT